MDSELKQYLDNLNERIDGLGVQTAAEFRQMREENAGEFRQMREENASAHAETRGLLRAEMAAAHAETRRVLRTESAAAHEETRGLLRAEMTAAHAETRLHFDSTIDRFESKFDLLAEGIKNIDEKLDREAADIRAEMRQGFADTHALIRFSHVQRPGRAKR